MSIIILVALLALAGCKGEGETISPSETHDNYEVKKLFVVDGCTVYRFYDGGVYYFTNCNGATTWRTTHYCGKGCITHEDHRVDTQVTP